MKEIIMVLLLIAMALSGVDSFAEEPLQPAAQPAAEVAPPTGYGEAEGSWIHEIVRDPMDDTISCRVQKAGASLPFPWFFFHSKEGLSISVVGDVYPGKSVRFRVDKKTVISGNGGLVGTQAKNLLTQIQGGGKELLVEFIEWPSGAPVYLELDLKGINEHLKVCKSAIKRH